MTDAERAAYEQLLTDAIETFVKRVAALTSTDPERAAAVAEFRDALSVLIEQVLSRATEQAAGVSVQLLTANETRLQAIEARLKVLEKTAGLAEAAGDAAGP